MKPFNDTGGALRSDMVQHSLDQRPHEEQAKDWRKAAQALAAATLAKHGDTPEARADLDLTLRRLFGDDYKDVLNQ